MGNRDQRCTRAVHSPQSRRHTIFNIALAVIGGALLYVTVRRVGWSDVQASIHAIGWWFVLVMVLGGLRFAARSMAWVVCAQLTTLRFRDAFSAMLAGDALGSITPLGLLASEPAKVLIVKSRLPTVSAVASVAAENAFYVASVLAMIAAGALVFLGVAGVPPQLGLAAQGILAGVLITALAGVWVARRRPSVLTQLARVVAPIIRRQATSLDRHRLREIEVHFYALLMWPAARIGRVFFWEALFHIGAVAEVFLVLKFISNATLLDAFVLETTGRLIVVVFKFVPYRLGVDEAGTALVAQALALNPAAGVTLALVRRIRILGWNAVGLGLLALRRS
jgi:Lysylphosphatidylglycerol synthase TM region